MITNRQWRLKRLVSEGEHPGPEHFEFGQAPVPDLQPGEILVQTIVLGTSPAQRMYVSTERQFHFAVAIGEVMSCRGVGRVVASRHAGFAVDDIVQASLGWQDYAVLAPEASEDPSHNVRNVRKVPAPVRPLTTVLGLFGQLAYSAYVGVIEVGQVRSGDTVVVSAAAGGVGSIACQLARIQGAERVIGIAGGQDKCRWLLERGLCDEVSGGPQCLPGLGRRRHARYCAAASGRRLTRRAVRHDFHRVPAAKTARADALFQPALSALTHGRLFCV